MPSIPVKKSRSNRRASAVSNRVPMTDNALTSTKAATATMSIEDKDQELVQDLESRIDALENQEEADFGSFSRADYIILIVGGLILPLIALVLAA
jgi:hypothetical protein